MFFGGADLGFPCVAMGGGAGPHSVREGGGERSPGAHGGAGPRPADQRRGRRACGGGERGGTHSR